MAIEVSFSIEILDKNAAPIIEEASLLAEPKKYADKLQYDQEIYGFLKVVSTGNPDVLIEDALWAIVQNLCFNSIVDLRKHKSIVVRKYSNYGYVRLDPESDLVRLSGDDLPDIKLNRQELALALFNCGERFIKFIQIIGDDHPEYLQLAEYLRGKAKLAKASIDDPNGFIPVR